MKSLFLVFISAFFLPIFIWASEGAGKVGNGGHVVTCDGGDRYELLDFYESRNTFGNRIDFDESLAQWPPGNEQDDIIVARRRLALILPLSHPIMKSFETAFYLRDHVRLVFAKQEVPSTGDTGSIHVSLPPGCEVLQLAVRTKINGVDTITISQKSYSRLLKTSRSGLFLHEALHDYFGSQSSTLAVRELLWWLSAERVFRSINRDLILEVIETKQSVEPLRFKIPAAR